MWARADNLPDGVKLAGDIAARKMSGVGATDAALSRIATLNPLVGAVVHVDGAGARNRAAGIIPGSSPLAGVPTLVKDLIDVKGMPTRRGSRTTSSDPATSQSALVDAMEAAGLVILGKSQTPEFGTSPTTEPLLGPITRNPVSIGHLAGGSSGGAAAAVASGMVAIAHGSDGGGSLRMPAACCGVFALKPSRGRLIDAGGPKPRIEMSVPGALSRSVRDSAAFLSLLERRDGAAPLAAVGHVEGPSKRRLRIGINLKGLNGQDPDAEIARVVLATADHCRALGHDVRPFAWNFDETAVNEALGTTMLFALSEIARGTMQRRGVTLENTGLEPLHLRMAEAGLALPPERVAETFQRLETVQAAYPAIFAQHDVILTPTLGQLPPLLGQLDNPARPLDEVLAGYADYSPYTPIQNVAGAPAMSLPLGISRSGLPIGVHVAGPIGAERTLLELAYELEATSPWRPGLTRGAIAASDAPREIAKAWLEAIGDGRDPVRFTRWIATLWGEDVLISHEPAKANDGPTKGAALALGEVAVFSALKRALPDYRQENVKVRASGDDINFYEEIVATLPSGQVARVPARYRFTLANGRIVRVHGQFDADTMKPFMDVVRAAGQRAPG
ncbi:amidase family protein [Novosphingobium sp. BL-52-GroH]|uniref:amidase family protein n=1 Tax=Novosphingobium sp. BL-52-GroH TaxID=3349877 RepID=UPI00384AEC10